MRNGGGAGLGGHWFRWIAGPVAGCALMGFAVFRQWRAEIGTYDALREIEGASTDPLSGFAEGIFASIMTWAFIVAAMFVGALIAAYVARTFWAGIATAALAFVARGLAGASIAARMELVRPDIIAAYRDIPGPVAVWVGAAATVIPAAVGGAWAGAWLVHRELDRLKREAFYRESMSRLPDSRKPTPAEEPAAATQPPAASAPATDAPAAVAERLAAHRAVAASERVALTCTSCGASNAPVRDTCIRCGAALQAT